MALREAPAEAERPLGDPRDPRAEPATGRPARPPRGPGPDWRTSVVTASGLNVLCGIWLIVAPWVLGYGHGDPSWNDVWAGAAIALLALARVAGAHRQSWMSRLNALIGCWLFAAAFWLDSSNTAGANDIVLGLVVFVLAVLSATASDEGTRPASWYRR